MCSLCVIQNQSGAQVAMFKDNIALKSIAMGLDNGLSSSIIP